MTAALRACIPAAVPTLDDPDESEAAIEADELLCQAYGLYRHAYEILDCLPTINTEGSLMYVYMSVCNNLAHTCAAASPWVRQMLLAEEEEASRWQDALHTTILSVPPLSTCPVYAHFANVDVANRMNFT